MCGYQSEIHQIRDPELSGCRVGLYDGQVVSVLRDWRDANHATHYTVRLPSGSIQSDVPEDQISFDLKLIRSKTQ